LPEIIAMNLASFFDPGSPVFTWVILPLLIFIARIADQSIGTLRLIFVSKGLKFLAPLIGFAESIIWLLAVSQIMKHLDNIVCFIAYGSGFATGNYVGILLEEKISIGKVIIRLFCRQENFDLIDRLHQHSYGLTIMDAQGSQGPVKVIFSVIERQNINQFLEIVKEVNPNTFYTIEDVKSAGEGIFKNNPRRIQYKLSFGPKKAK
jgi:uncharacterized protein YebE (UPF0316 family)